MNNHLDTFHMNIEEDSFTRDNNRKFPELGNMPWREIFTPLEMSGYQGPIAMEPFVRPSGEVGEAVSFYRNLMDLTTDYENDLRLSVTSIRDLMK